MLGGGEPIDGNLNKDWMVADKPVPTWFYGYRYFSNGRALFLENFTTKSNIVHTIYSPHNKIQWITYFVSRNA